GRAARLASPTCGSLLSNTRGEQEGVSHVPGVRPPVPGTTLLAAPQIARAANRPRRRPPAAALLRLQPASGLLHRTPARSPRPHRDEDIAAARRARRRRHAHEHTVCILWPGRASTPAPPSALLIAGLAAFTTALGSADSARGRRSA